MNLQQPNSNEATRSSKPVRECCTMSGICTRCIDGCRGNCEVSGLHSGDRELIYLRTLRRLTAGGDKIIRLTIPTSTFRICPGCGGFAPGVTGNPDTATFPGVNTETITDGT